MSRGTFLCMGINAGGGATLMFAVKLAKNLKFFFQIGLQFFRPKNQPFSIIFKTAPFYKKCSAVIKMVSSKQFVERNQ